MQPQRKPKWSLSREAIMLIEFETASYTQGFWWVLFLRSLKRSKCTTHENKASRAGPSKHMPLTIVCDQMMKTSSCAYLRAEQPMCKVPSSGSYEACCVSGRFLPLYPFLNINSCHSYWKSKQHVSNAENLGLSVLQPLQILNSHFCS